ncbi:hypothetical protein [Streptomyces syringium]|uniref:hypothetical protein n=1 Tax=Streptomyces syringium TaxID=76729 RepID=UPI003AAADAEA
MQTIGGRRFANRNDLIEYSGYSRAYLAARWRDRETNGHPDAINIDGVMHWDLEVWDDWFQEFKQQRRDESRTVDRKGDPDEELPPAAQARVLGIDLSRINQYSKNPPPGWPAPVRVEQLPTRTREYRTRQQLWDFHDHGLRVATPGGRPPGPAAKTKGPDPRVEQAVKALTTHPDRAPGEVAGDLADHHGGSIHTWKRIVTQARRQMHEQGR